MAADRHASLLFPVLLLFVGAIQVSLTAPAGSGSGSAAGSSASVVPRFVVEPLSAVVRAGSTGVTLTCAVQPETAGVIRWTINGTTAAATGFRRRGIDVRDGTLRIAAYSGSLSPQQLQQQAGGGGGGEEQVSHDGVYQCVAVTQVGTIVSAEARLETAFLDQFDGGPNTRSGSGGSTVELSSVEGNVAAVPCPAIPASRPAPVIEFELNGVKVANSGRHVVLPSGTLLIGNVTRADQGTYRCSAYNVVTGTRSQSPVTHRLTVTAAANAAQTATTFTWTSGDSMSVVQGSNLTLECVAHGFPVPQVSWEKYGGHLPAGRHTILLGNLAIHSVQRFDAGTYLCKGNNGVGHQQAKVIAVDVIERPTIETPPTDQNATEGSTVVFKCRAQGSPRVTTQWLFNGVQVANEQFVSIRDTTLTLSNLQRRQSGLYQCVARNSLGMTHASARLVVVETLVAPPSATTRTPPGPGRVPAGPASNFDDFESNEYTDEDDWDTDFMEESGVFSPGGEKPPRRPEERPGRNRENTQDARLAAPSKPEVSHVTDTSAAVRWSVPSGAASTISTFKVQYRDVQEPSLATPWQTAEDDISPEKRSFQLNHLRPGGTYRFRVVAIYSNNDNRHGLSSSKVTLGTNPEHRPKVLVPGPVIVEVQPLSIGEIFIKWQQPETDRWDIEGFYIYYAPYSTDQIDYQRQVVLGPTGRHAVLSHLEPDTSYSIRIQSYTTAGTLSEFSNTVVKATLSNYPVDLPSDVGGGVNPASRTGPRTVTSRPKHQLGGGGYNMGGGDSDGATRHTEVETSLSSVGGVGRGHDGQMLYIILSIVAGVIVIVIAACTVMCLWKRRQQQRNLAAAKEQSRLEHSDQTTAFLATHLIMNSNADECRVGGTDYKFKVNGSHVPGCAGGCNAAIAGLHGNGSIVHCLGCGPGIDPNDRNNVSRTGMKKMVPELLLPPPPPLPPLPPAVPVYNQLSDVPTGPGRLHAPTSAVNPGTSPIYSKLLNHDDSMSSFDDHMLPPAAAVPRMYDLQDSTGGHYPSPDHIPRSHEVHPYWVLEQVAPNGYNGDVSVMPEDQGRLQRPAPCWRRFADGPHGQPASLNHIRNDGARQSHHNYAGAATCRPGIGYDSATTVTSPADSCDDSLDESSSDIFGVAPVDVSDLESIRDSTIAGSTLRSDYENVVGQRQPQQQWVPDDSWKSLTEHVNGGGYQIRQTSLPMTAGGGANGAIPRRANDYPPSDIDDYR